MPRRFLFSLFPVAVLVVMVEAASYGYYRYALADDFMPIDISDSFHDIPDLFERRSTDAGDVLFSRYFPTRYYVSDRNYRGKTMAATKTRETYRVFTFGGSSTAGSPWGHEASFSRFLEDELGALRRPATRVEVVNFGGGGYGSTRALGLVEASIRYQPDLVVFYEGHNEMSDNWIYRDVARNQTHAGFRRFANHLYAFRVADSFLNQTRARPPARVDLLKSNAMFVPRPIEDKRGFKALDRGYLAAQFRENLQSIIRTARDHGAQVVLVSQPSNSFYEPSWFPGDGNQAEQLLIDEMRTAYARRDYASVRVRAVDALRLNRDNPLAHFFGGLAASHQGDSGAAREHLLMAIDLDESPERFTRAYRDIERALGQEWPEAFFVDAWQAAIDFVDDGLVDGRLVIDKMHPTVEGHKLIARAIVENFFVRHHVRDDLFDYTRDDPSRIWKNNIDPDFYHVICTRYFDVAEPSGCVDEVAGRHAAAAQGSPQWRIYRSSWEYLFYYGLRSGDAAWLQRAAQIYRGPSLEHAMAPQPSLRAAQ